ncbi:PP2C family protein-serine/threonine phosphatase [Methanobacterium oryzae]|uniref:PP2C family protein-serine/threonine phosphatase n=1 Tax=Methanobacterium oryzae TaxID=69540 RepID=UPI003D1A8111
MIELQKKRIAANYSKIKTYLRVNEEHSILNLHALIAIIGSISVLLILEGGEESLGLALHSLLVLIEKTCVIIVIAYIVSRIKYFQEILDGKFTFKNQAIIILIFGAISIFGSYSGVSIFGALANVRDLGPMIAGLIGGPIVGLGAGLIGGLYRYFFLGGLTTLPCSIATILAGLFAGIIFLANGRKFIGIFGAVVFAVLMETFHILLVVLIVKPQSLALTIAEELTIPVVFANALGILVFSFIISNLLRERKTSEERNVYFDELERKKNELKVAQKIQQTFLPDSIPLLKDFDVAAINIPAKEVGGDFYDFIPITEDKIGIAIANVSEKGVPAALLMALSKTIVQTKARKTNQVSEVMEYLNKLVMIEAESGIDLSLFYSVLDMKNKTLTYINAGHESPLVFKKDTSNSIELANEDFKLGKLINIEFKEKEISLNSGDIMVFYTDGIVDALNEEEESFGIDKLKLLINENYNLPSEDIVLKIKQEISFFSKDNPQFDDMTLVVLKVD